MTGESGQRKPSRDEEFEYLTFVSERLIDITKLNFLIITAAISAAAIISKYRELGYNNFIEADFIIFGMVTWIAALSSVAALFFRTKPSFVVESSPLEVSERYKRLEQANLRNKNLNILSNYLIGCFLLTILSGLSFVFGIIEIGLESALSDDLFWSLFSLFVFFIGFSVVIHYLYVWQISSFWIITKNIRYYIRENTRCWYADPSVQYHRVSWMDIYDYRILKYLDRCGEQNIGKIATKIGSTEEHVRQRAEVLDNKDMIRETERKNLVLELDGYKFLRGHSMIYK